VSLPCPFSGGDGLKTAVSVGPAVAVGILARRRAGASRAAEETCKVANAADNSKALKKSVRSFREAGRAPSTAGAMPAATILKPALANPAENERRAAPTVQLPVNASA